MIDINIDELFVKLAGVAGALVSVRYLQGSRKARFSMVLSGAVVSIYASPWLAEKMGMPEGFTGFIVGMFGMAIVSRIWEWIQSAPIPAIWQALLDLIPRRRP